jgi:hypothetical protein
MLHRLAISSIKNKCLCCGEFYPPDHRNVRHHKQIAAELGISFFFLLLYEPKVEGNQK